MNKLSKPGTVSKSKIAELKARQATVEPLVLMAALRYALGRMTYIVSTVADAIIQNIDVFNKSELQIMHKEISTELKDGGGGHRCDIEDWQRVLRRIEETSIDNFDIDFTKGYPL